MVAVISSIVSVTVGMLMVTFVMMRSRIMVTGRARVVPGVSLQSGPFTIEFVVRFTTIIMFVLSSSVRHDLSCFN